MKRSDENHVDLTKLRVAAVLNKSSGSCDADCAEKLATILSEAKIKPISIELVEGKDIEATLKNIVAAKIDVLVILGGDGTIRTAAERCAASGTKIIPLPGGTMNMLPRALYGEGTWQEVLRKTLFRPSLLDVGGGCVEGHRFFCAGIFGSPALWGGAREAVRKNLWSTALAKAIRAYHRAFSQKLYCRVNSVDDRDVTALSVICPLISSALSSKTPMFEVIVLQPQDLADAFHLAWSAVFSQWRKDKSVESVKATRVEVSAKRVIPAILDGEIVSLRAKAEIEYEERAFVAVVPT
jgi:diacylglycerol kinase family enzyme